MTMVSFREDLVRVELELQIQLNHTVVIMCWDAPRDKLTTNGLWLGGLLSALKPRFSVTLNGVVELDEHFVKEEKSGEDS